MIAALIGGAPGCVGYGIPAPTLIPRREAVTWGGLGIGVGSPGFGAQADLTRARDGKLLRARWNIQGDDGNWSGNTSRSVSEFAIMAGRGRICCSGSQWAAVALGGSILTGTKGSPAEDFTTLGVAGELMLVTGKIPHIAISINGNANPEMPFLSANIAILIGRMPFISSAPVRRRF